MGAAQAAVDAGAEVDPEVVHSKVEEIGATIERCKSVKKMYAISQASANDVESD